MKSLRRITAVTLSAAMVAGLITGPVTTSYAAGSVEKEETVYVNQTANGDVKSITVSDWLKNVTGTGEIKDKSNLKDIKNVKGNETFEESNGNLTWKANDTDIYYQGTTSEKPPVAMEVSYKLDGKDIKPDDLAGKSGKIEITIKYINKTSYEDEVDGEKTELQNPFLMASAVILPVDNFTNVEVSQGKLVSEGSNQILVAYGMPGLFDSLKVSEDTREKLESHLSDTVTITADVTDFELASIYTVASADEFSSIDLGENSDMDDLEDALDKLDDASEDLVSGSDTLSEGIGTLKDNFKTYSSGVSKVSKGASSLSTGANKLSKGITSYTDGVKKVTDGTADYIKGTGSLASGVKAYVAGEKQVAEGASKLNDGTKQLSAGYSQLSAGINEYTTKVDAIANGSMQLKAGSAALVTGAEEVVDGINATKTALTPLGQEVQKLRDDGHIITLKALLDPADNTLTPTQKAALQAALTAISNEGKTIEAIQATQTAGKDPQELVDGAKALDAGIKNISDNKDALLTAGDELRKGNTSVGSGISSVASGMAGLYAGINKLSENNEALTTGADTLEKSGSLLTSGIGQLTSNTKSLTNGAVDLSKGAKQLSTGVASLNTATGKVFDGIGKLSDGSNKLSEGMSKFKDEGTDKLKREYNNKVKTVLDRLDSVTGEAGQYKTFSGIADGMDGKVKFIFQTAEIKTEK